MYATRIRRDYLFSLCPGRSIPKTDFYMHWDYSCSGRALLLTLCHIRRELRASLDTLKQETEKQAQAHLVVAQAIKTDLEGPTAAFIQKQQQHKRTMQAAIEKEFKTKQTQEGYVNRAREKYEADCVRINSYTAQSTLIQGRDLEKVHLKLERAQQTVQANQRDFANFARALQDTMQKWEHSWKSFCDTCQDLEEERIEFMKDNMWAYANAVSTVCVSDDEVRLNISACLAPAQEL